MNAFRLIFTLVLLCSCESRVISESKTNNKNYNVELLFEFDGIKLYRFHDQGRYHYFTSNGQAISHQTRTQVIGKQIHHRSYDENISEKLEEARMK